MFDITPVLEALFKLVVAIVIAFLIPWIQEKKKTEKMAKIFSIAEQVVYAAWELDITGELIEMGTTKVEYAWNEAKKILADKNIAVDDDELKAYIKSEVAKLRIMRGDEIIEVAE
jgi:alcohol dehydrogenase YqhD (iron-dependent ADH family)